MLRDEIQEHCAKAIKVAENPAVVLCIEPFSSVERDGGERLGKLLARLMDDPDHALLVATGDAFVFAFGDQFRQTDSA
jgi:ABC-type lipoprotein export system ATPase subunit